MVNIVTVDHSDGVHLKYDHKWHFGNWTDSSTDPPSVRPLLTSTDMTAQLVMVFPIPGTGVSYYGLRRSAGARFQICIDCDPDQPAGPIDTIDALNESNKAERGPPVLLYSKQGLSNQVHTVILMNTNDTREHAHGESHISLDRFEITTQEPLADIGDSRSSNASLVGGSMNVSVEGGLIAGVVIGIIALLMLLMALLLHYPRKRRTAVESSIEEGQISRDVSTPVPFVIRHTHYGRRPNSSRSTLSLMYSSDNFATFAMKGLMSGDTAEILRLAARPLPTISDPGISISVAPPPTSRLAIDGRIEIDAGPVENDDTLPPDYAQVFNSRPVVVSPPANPSSNMPHSQNKETW